MGAYLNPGKLAFQEAVQSEIFVDKSEMLAVLNRLVETEQKYVCVSRPRRFGKTMAAKMLCAYYGRGADSRALFEGLKISEHADLSKMSWDYYLGKFDVIRVTMTDFFNSKQTLLKGLEKMQALILRDMIKAYPKVDFFDPHDLPQSCLDIYTETGTRFVLVIDEWDSIFREYKEDVEGQTLYLDFLRDWMRDKEYIALAYMTGILPIKKYGKQSALNMFDEYTMTQPMNLAEYVGFTESEVRDLCEKYVMNYDRVSEWYDGYKLSDYIPVNMRKKLLIEGEYAEHKLSVYSPLSVVKAMRFGIIDNYWNKTENYEALAEYIRRDFDSLKETVALLMDGGRVHANLNTYQNDMTTFHGKDDILALLVYLGYLGFIGDEEDGRINSEQGEVFIPNREILDVFKTSTETSEWADTFKDFEMSQQLLKATW